MKVYSTAEIQALGMQCLAEKLGIVNMEYFIKVIKRESFDYTKWQREYFDSKSDEELRNAIKLFCDKNVYEGDAEVI